jgi:DNA mismatch endonuclease (patch repair protein)
MREDGDANAGIGGRTMTDTMTADRRSGIMRAIRSHGNLTTEIRLAAMMSDAGLAGWTSQSRLMGSIPDFIFPARRLAIFVDGCFWHGCPEHYQPPATRTAWWEAKIGRNRERDRAIVVRLSLSGWRTVRIWEHELDDREGTLARIAGSPPPTT